MKWVKNFGIKADVLTIYALASGCNFIKNAYGLPNCINYRYIDAEESRTEEYMNKLKEIVKKDIKIWVNRIVKKLSLVVDDFEDFCKKENIIQIKNYLMLIRNFIRNLVIFLEFAIFLFLLKKQ